MMDDLRRALDLRAAAGEPVTFWLRDDDAIAPTPALDRLLDIAARVPLTLAVIPAGTGLPLADRLAGAPGVSVALHGWGHANHATGGEKKQELGRHRAAPVVLAELAQGHAKLRALHGARYVPVLVPPWNRIDGSLLAALPGIGIAALSVFGPARPAALPVVNTHVDLMDWHGTGGAWPAAHLSRAILRALSLAEPVGLLTHHLVHDGAAWDFLQAFVALTADHPGCRWAALPDLAAGAAPLAA